MATFYSTNSPASSVSIAAIGLNGATAPVSSIEVGGIGADGNLHGLVTTNAGILVTSPDPAGVQHVIVDSSALPTGASTSALQTTGNTSLSSITANQTNGTQVTQVTGTVPLPTGAATSALQTTGNTSIASIDTKTPALGAAASASSRPVVLATDQGLSTAAVRQSIGSFTATTQTATINPSGASVINFQLSGTFVGTVTFEYSNDNGTTYSPLFGWDQGNVGFSSTGNVSGRAYVCPAYGNLVRARCSAYTSGTIVCTMIAGLGQMPGSYVSPVTFFTVQGSAALGSTGTGVQPLQVGGLFQTTPATLTNNQQGALQQDASQNLLVNLKTAIPAGANIIGSLTANQSVNNAQINGVTPLMGNGVTGTGSQRVTIASDTSSNTNPFLVTQNGYTKSNTPTFNLYSSTPVTTAAYVQMVASTTAAVKQLQIFDSSGQAMILASGAAASEVDQLYIPPGGGTFNLTIAASTRITVKALSANTGSNGYLIINYFG